MSLVSPSLWITPVKISASGLMYVTGVTFLMDNSSEVSGIGLIYVTESRSLVSPSLWITAVKISASGLCMSLVLRSLVSPSLWITQ